MTDSGRLLLGEIVGVFGVQGQLKLRSFADPPEALTRYRPWYLVHRDVETELARPKCRKQGKGLILDLPEVTDRDAAEAMVGAQVWVARAALPDLPAGEYYWADLEGLDVHTVDGVALGRVAHLFSTGSNDVVVVRGDRERLIPFLQPDVIRAIDLDQRRMTVDWDPEF